MRSRLIQLEQIEHGVELLNALSDLQKKIIELSEVNQYITNSNHIYIQKDADYNRNHQVHLTINQEYIKELKEEIVDMVLNTYNDSVDNPQPIVFGVVQDILHKLEILLNRETLYKRITDSLTTREITEIEQIVQVRLDEELAKAIVDIQNELQRFVNEQIRITREELDITLSELRSEIETTNTNMGNLSMLHPYIVEALGNSISIKDAINLLFQIIIDMNNNIVRINNSAGNTIELENSYNKELPTEYGDGAVSYNVPEQAFSLNEDLGVTTDTYDDSTDFGSIAEEILYRKTLNDLNGGGR